MKAFILAGGLGKRLSHIISDVPKPMAPIGSRPFLEIQIEFLRKSGITDIVILCGYKCDVIRDHFKDGSSFGVNINYSVENEPIGTGGAIKKALDDYKDEENVLILNGDTYFDVDIGSLLDFHMTGGGILTIALKYHNDVKRYGSVTIENYRVKGFIEKSVYLEDDLINGGIYILNRKAIGYFNKKKGEGMLSFEKEALPSILESEAVYGLPFGGKFIDIGVPEDYALANRDLPGWLASPRIKAVFLDRDGVINEDTGYTYRVSDLRIKTGVIPFMKNITDQGFSLVITTNQAGVARGKFTEEDYNLFQRCLIDVLSDEGIKVLGSYSCMFHPEAIVDRYRKDSFLRKPKPGMVLTAADEHFIDLNKSFMVGDKESDIIELPYLKTFLIRGGYPVSANVRLYDSFNEVEEEILKNG